MEPSKEMDLNVKIMESLSFSTLTELTQGLTVQNAMKNDWRSLACHLGFSATHIHLIMQDRQSNKARLLFEAWDHSGKSSLRKLIVALYQLNLKSSLQVLRDSDELRGRVDFAALERMAREWRPEDLFPRIPDSTPVCDLETERVSSYHHPQLCSMPVIDHDRDTHVECPVDDLDHRLNTIVPRTIFISYYPESSRRFKSQLRKLVETLHSYGFKVFFDEACSKDIKQQGGKHLWKEMCIQRAETILVICTPKFYNEDLHLSSGSRKVKKPQISVDSRLLRLVDPQRLIPVMLGHDDPSQCIPFFLRGLVCQQWPGEDLMYSVTGTPKYVPRPGPKKTIRPIMIDPKVVENWNPFDEPASHE